MKIFKENRISLIEYERLKKMKSKYLHTWFLGLTVLLNDTHYRLTDEKLDFIYSNIRVKEGN